MRKLIDSYAAVHQVASLSEAGTFRDLLQFYGHNISLSTCLGLSSAIGFIYGADQKTRPLAPDYHLPRDYAAPILPFYLRNIWRVTNVWTQGGRTNNPGKLRGIIKKYVNEGRPVVFEVETTQYFTELESRGAVDTGHGRSRFFSPENGRLGGYLVTVIGYDDENDTLIISEVSLKTPIEVSAGRFFECCLVSGGYIPPEGEWTVFYVPPKLPSWKYMIANAIRRMVHQTLHPFTNCGYKFGLEGLESFGADLHKSSESPEKDQTQLQARLASYLSMIEPEPEQSGFRKMYAAFLEEAAEQLGDDGLRTAAGYYYQLQERWAELNRLIRIRFEGFNHPGQSGQTGESIIHELFQEILSYEKRAVSYLESVIKNW